jgi:hypothetical protein
MLRNSRLVAILLVVAFAATAPSAQLLAMPSPPAGHPAGCHDSGPAAPSPAPSSYQCCVSGHQSAIPGASFSLRPTVASSPVEVENLNRSLINFSSRDFSRLIPSDSPPGAFSLRI